MEGAGRDERSPPAQDTSRGRGGRPGLAPGSGAAPRQFPGPAHPPTAGSVANVPALVPEPAPTCAPQAGMRRPALQGAQARGVLPADGRRGLRSVWQTRPRDSGERGAGRAAPAGIARHACCLVKGARCPAGPCTPAPPPYPGKPPAHQGAPHPGAPSILAPLCTRTPPAPLCPLATLTPAPHTRVPSRTPGPRTLTPHPGSPRPRPPHPSGPPHPAPRTLSTRGAPCSGLRGHDSES